MLPSKLDLNTEAFSFHSTFKKIPYSADPFLSLSLSLSNLIKEFTHPFGEEVKCAPSRTTKILFFFNRGTFRPRPSVHTFSQNQSSLHRRSPL